MAYELTSTKRTECSIYCMVVVAVVVVVVVSR